MGKPDGEAVPPRGEVGQPDTQPAAEGSPQILWMCHVIYVVIYIDKGLSPIFGDGPGR